MQALLPPPVQSTSVYPKSIIISTKELSQSLNELIHIRSGYSVFFGDFENDHRWYEHCGTFRAISFHWMMRITPSAKPGGNDCLSRSCATVRLLGCKGQQRSLESHHRGRSTDVVIVHIPQPSCFFTVVQIVTNRISDRSNAFITHRLVKSAFCYDANRSPPPLYIVLQWL